MEVYVTAASLVSVSSKPEGDALSVLWSEASMNTRPDLKRSNYFQRTKLCSKTKLQDIYRDIKTYRTQQHAHRKAKSIIVSIHRQHDCLCIKSNKIHKVI